MKDEEKDCEWNYDDGNRYRSSWAPICRNCMAVTSRTNEIDPKAKTPAYEMEDGVDMKWLIPM